ncbi:MAG: hypothetical protein ABIK31_08075 [candidate division WOR-3 bacterium]
MKYQSFLIKIINPTKTELSGDYEIGNTLHNRIISTYDLKLLALLLN